jgi:hypothetical protein
MRKVLATRNTCVSEFIFTKTTKYVKARHAGLDA